MTNLERMRFLRDHLTTHFDQAEEWIYSPFNSNRVPCLLFISPPGNESICNLNLYERLSVYSSFSGGSGILVYLIAFGKHKLLEQFNRSIAILEEHEAPEFKSEIPTTGELVTV